MCLQVEVICTEMVKPSSPTPQHLRRYSLSFLDQITPQVNNSMVYFFDAVQQLNIIDAPERLKKSLSQLLTHYYPLAGRLITKNLIVDCNDDGVPFVETKVRCHLSHVVTNNPSPADVSKLLPYEMDEAVDTVLGVQFNVFQCGGIAIGVCISHKIADALSYFQFVKNWATMTRGEPDQQIMTHFQSFTLFPPKDMSSYNPDCLVAKEKIVCKRFVFEASAIESLRSKYTEKAGTNILEGQKPPSRVEVLSTFIWTRIIAATKEEEEKGRKKIQLVAWTVNLRPRMEPPLPEYAFGNYYWPMRTFPTLGEQGKCHDLGRKLREELNKIDKHFIAKLQEREERNPNQMKEEMVRSSGDRREELLAFGFTSLCRFPVYDVDFGWGNPTWVGPPTWKFKNVVTLKDTKSSCGIEAYVSLTEEDMAKFEHDDQFLAYVSTKGLK